MGRIVLSGVVERRLQAQQHARLSCDKGVGAAPAVCGADLVLRCTHEFAPIAEQQLDALTAAPR